MTAGDISARVEACFRSHRAELAAAITREFGTRRLELIEESVQDAMVRALTDWAAAGVPRNPVAWLYVTARHQLIDRLRNRAEREERTDPLSLEAISGDSGTRVPSIDPLEDDVLKMTFVCCHPELPRRAQIAMVLKTLCGLGNAEIGRVLLMREEAVKKALTRARRRIAELRIPFELPDQAHVDERLDALLQCLYAVFSEGHMTHGGETDIDAGLCERAMLLTELLTRARGVADPGRVHALASLMFLQAARLPARVDANGKLVRLSDQDRSLWNAEWIRRGMTHLARSTSSERRSVYHLQAAIAACHAVAPNYRSTDWVRILRYYDDLLEMNPSVIVRINRAVAIALTAGYEVALAELDALSEEPGASEYSLLSAVRADFLSELGRRAEAQEWYERALAVTSGTAARIFLHAQLDACCVDR